MDHNSNIKPSNPNKQKKILESPLFASAVVPLGIILVAILIIWGITTLLSGEKNYRDLISEMNSKTFGNRWISAFELSKVLANNKIPPEEVPWVVENLKKVYMENNDPRTKNFIVLALSSLSTPDCVPFFLNATNETDSQISFNAIVALGKYPSGSIGNLDGIVGHLDSPDPGIVQATIFVLAHHLHLKSQSAIQKLMGSTDWSLRYAAATALISFQDESALPVLSEILKGNKISASADQIENLQMRVIDALRRKKWQVLASEVDSIAKNRTNLKLSVHAQELLNFFKN